MKSDGRSGPGSGPADCSCGGIADSDPRRLQCSMPFLPFPIGIPSFHRGDVARWPPLLLRFVGVQRTGSHRRDHRIQVRDKSSTRNICLTLRICADSRFSNRSTVRLPSPPSSARRAWIICRQIRRWASRWPTSASTASSVRNSVLFKSQNLSN